MQMTAVGLWSVLMVSLSVNLINKFGSRLLMITGLIFISVGLSLIGAGDVVFYNHVEISALTAIGGVFVFILGFQIGPGPMFFVLASEAFPFYLKSKSLRCPKQHSL